MRAIHCGDLFWESWTDLNRVVSVRKSRTAQYVQVHAVVVSLRNSDNEDDMCAFSWHLVLRAIRCGVTARSIT